MKKCAAELPAIYKYASATQAGDLVAYDKQGNVCPLGPELLGDSRENIRKFRAPLDRSRMFTLEELKRIDAKIIVHHAGTGARRNMEEVHHILRAKDRLQVKPEVEIQLLADSVRPCRT